MIEELYINEVDAWLEYGVNMGEGFLNAIDAFVPMKDYIENESRLQHGKRIIIKEDFVKVASRELTLKFHLRGKNADDFLKKRALFEGVLKQGKIKIEIPKYKKGVYYRLVYLGKSVDYAMNWARTSCTIAAKFIEQNPMNRTFIDEDAAEFEDKENE